MDRQTEKSLHRAIKDHNEDEINQLLSSNVRNVNKAVEPVLCTAAQEGVLNIVRLLLDAGALVNGKAGKTGHQPLHIAAKNGCKEICDLLTKNGADIHAKTESGDSALYIAVMAKQPEIVDYLIRAGANVNEPSSYLFSRNKPIHGAAMQDSDDILNLILETNATNIDAINDNKSSALHIAAGAGKPRNVSRLIKCGISINCTDSSGKTPIEMSCENGHVEVVRLLCVAGARISCENGLGSHPLDIAVSKRYINVVRTLLHFGADVNRKDSQGRTPFHKSITSCKHKMREKWGGGAGVSVNSEIEMLDTLLQYRADINCKDHSGWTPLHLCVKDGCESVLDYLLNSGADYNLVTNEGISALQLACSHNITPAVEILIQNCPGLVNHVCHVPLDDYQVNSQSSCTFIQASKANSVEFTPLCMLWQKRNLEGLRLLLEGGYVIHLKERDFIEFNNQRKDRKKVDGPIKSLLQLEMNNPWKLSRICRTLIRDKLHSDLQRKVTFLPVPDKIKSSLMLVNALWL